MWNNRIGLPAFSGQRTRRFVNPTRPRSHGLRNLTVSRRGRVPRKMTSTTVQQNAGRGWLSTPHRPAGPPGVWRPE